MKPSSTRIAFASFIGTAIEFYDFYIYGLAVAMVIGPVFFSRQRPGGAGAECLPHLRHCVPRAPARRVAVRAFRRPHRAQDDAGRILAGDGRVHDIDRRVARL